MPTSRFEPPTPTPGESPHGTDAQISGATPDDPSLCEAACRRIAHLADRVGERDLPRVNVDIQAIVARALRALPRIKSMRAEAVRQLPLHDLTLFDAFEDIVLALGCTDTEVRASPKGHRATTTAARALQLKRAQLQDVALGLARFGLLDEAPRSPRKLAGYRRLVADLSHLVPLLRRNWDKVAGKVPFTLDDLDEVDREVIALTRTLVVDERRVAPSRNVISRRRQIYALFRDAVADLRRIATYLYGDKGANAIIPAFANVANPAARKRKSTPRRTVPTEPTSNG